MDDIQSPKDNIMPFTGDFYGSDGRIRNLDEFIAALLGGVNGQGAPGKSAYQIAVEQGFVGTVEEWLVSLNGKDGNDGIDGKDGAGVDGGLFQSVLTYDDLPLPANDHRNELYFVRESTGGALAFMGVHKYPRGFYAVDENDEWEHIPLNLSVAEDAFTVVNITDWAVFQEFVKKINAGDAVLYDGVFYQSLTGVITDDPPDNDSGNWAVLQGWKGKDGEDGKNGKDGKDGVNGKDGKSAYEIAVANGFTGNEAAWLDSLNNSNSLHWFRPVDLTSLTISKETNEVYIYPNTGFDVNAMYLVNAGLDNPMFDYTAFDIWVGPIGQWRDYYKEGKTDALWGLTASMTNDGDLHFTADGMDLSAMNINSIVEFKAR